MIIVKVKLFDCEDEVDLQDEMNEFLRELEGDVIDIKYSICSFPTREEQIYCFSSMIVYNEK